ncbi:hypothetical protein PF008_g12792 [Phytophthora fragariae]|uniref:Uncharacterized protein n=1 Tax=Phytophthora fragariae TaxID=53985 RepID=A0A6G0RLY7_9STRA|nr:hypothetical protein PF008_g12792 [Phytophthora fragariae]
MSRCRRLQINRRSRSILSAVLTAGSPTWMSSSVTSSVDCVTSGSTAISISTSSALRSPPS